jgi:alkylhydroperoxidase family enzyme
MGGCPATQGVALGWNGIAPLGLGLRAIARTEREIALMQECRTRLTADVVTGKLDVRPLSAVLLPTARQAGAQAGAAAHLPEIAREPATDDSPEELEAEQTE